MNRNDVMFGEDLPPDVAPVTSALDALAAGDRASIPAGLTDRVYRASLPALRAAKDEPAVYAFPRPRPASAWRGLAMAAGLALLATVGAVWPTGRHPTSIPASTSITDADLDALLTLADASDSAASDSVDQIAADADDVARAVSDSWMPDDLFYSSDESNEESL